MKVIQLSLTDSEGATLREVLGSFLSDLRMEIADTEDAGFRGQLKQKELVITKLLEILGG